MEVLTPTNVRDFRVRGNYFSWRSLLSRRDLHSSKKHSIGPNQTGYSPPAVDFELQEGTTSSVVVSESDIPLLYDDDIEKAKRYLFWIIEARRGDPQAATELRSAAQEYSFEEAKRAQPSESRFVVPCTSCQTHSQQAISQKAFTLLKLCQLGYPVPEFVVLTAQAYEDRDHNFDRHLADALTQLETVTMQDLGYGKTPLVFAIRCATGHYIPGVMDTYLNVGVTEKSLPALEMMYGRVPARKMFLNNLRNLCRLLDRDRYASIVNAVRTDLPAEEVDRFVEQLTGILAKTDRKLIEDPFAQAVFFARQAYKDFEENQELVVTLCRGTDDYPSLILQKMICTVRDETAYAGVLCSRHTQTGTGVELQTAHNIFGEEMMTGTAEIESTAFDDRETIKELFPAVYHFVPHLPELERDFESPVTINLDVPHLPALRDYPKLGVEVSYLSGNPFLDILFHFGHVFGEDCFFRPQPAEHLLNLVTVYFRKSGIDVLE